MFFMQKKLIAMLVLIVVLGFYQGQREWFLRSLSIGGEHARSPRPWRTEAERLSYFNHRRAFADLWLARDRNDVRQKIELYLNDPTFSLRLSAVRALGWLEKAESLPSLDKMQKRIQTGQEQDIRLQTVQLAKARIQTRSLKGKNRLDVYAKSVGLSWNEVVRLSRKVNTPATNAERVAVAGSPAAEIVIEAINLLYSMSKKHENITSFSESLALTPAQRSYLQAAHLPEKQEANFLLDAMVLKPPKGDSSGEEELIKNHVVGLGKTAQQQVLLLLEKVSVSPKKFFPTPETTRGYMFLFRAAANTGSSKAIVPLRKLKNHPYKWFSYYASQSLQKLEERSAAPNLPA